MVRVRREMESERKKWGGCGERESGEDEVREKKRENGEDEVKESGECGVRGRELGG